MYILFSNIQSGLILGVAKPLYPSAGDSYVGDVVFNLAHGQGKCLFGNGKRYEGSWVKGKIQGRGMLTGKDGSKYVGDFANDLRNGKGVQSYGEGDGDEKEYTGEWRGDKKSGKGTMIYKSGLRFTGEWVDDQVEGEGTLEDEKGAVIFKGHWKDSFFFFCWIACSFCLHFDCLIYLWELLLYFH
jgi:hypothetical protein